MGRMAAVLAAATLWLTAACGGETPPPRAPTQPVPVAEGTPTPTPTPTPTSTPAPALDHPGPKALPGTGITFGGGDGSSIDKAIVIHGARGETDGVASEYQYLSLLYGPRGQRWQMQQQSLLENKGRSFDELDVVLDGKPATFVFDITEYFGKM